VGFGLAVAAVIGRREAERRALAAARHPNEPWLWRQDWASGRIEDSGRKGQYGWWGFAVLWNLISFPSALLALREAHQHGNRLALIALIFPVVGLIVAAGRSSIRQRKFGLSSLELGTSLAITAAVPGVDYGATFEVPVFRTTASAEPLTPDEDRLLGPTPERLPYQQPAGSPIRVATGPRGTQIVFPAARNPGAALGLTRAARASRSPAGSPSSATPSGSPPAMWGTSR
jgi:hypothetical protein